MQPVGYIRQSRRADLDQAMSYDSQLTAIHQLAKAHGDDPAQVVILADMGRSGGRGKERLRAGYQDLLRRLEAGEISTIYALNLSRLARSMPELYRLMDRASEKRTRVVTAKEGLQDPKTPIGKLTFGIFALVGEFYLDNQREAAQENADAHRDRGDVMGRARFGSRPGEDVQKVIEAFRTAGSWNGAAKLLNAAEPLMPSALGRKWRPISVRLVVEHHAPDLTPKHPAVGVASAPGGGFRLSRLLRCPYDGRFLTGAQDRKRKGVVYRCHGADGDTAHPHPRSVQEAAVLPWVEAEAALYRDPEVGGETGPRRDLEKERDTLQQKRVALAYQVIDGGLTREEARVLRASIDEQIAALAPSTLLPWVHSTKDGRRVMTLPKDFLEPSAWPPAKVNEVFRSLFVRVELDGSFSPVRAEWHVPEWRST
jgi:DNA invertase Pin-like site-specific DNA recombinase